MTNARPALKPLTLVAAVMLAVAAGSSAQAQTSPVSQQQPLSGVGPANVADVSGSVEDPPFLASPAATAATRALTPGAENFNLVVA
jgi:hypothetical protein